MKQINNKLTSYHVPKLRTLIAKLKGLKQLGSKSIQGEIEKTEKIMCFYL